MLIKTKKIILSTLLLSSLFALSACSQLNNLTVPNSLKSRPAMKLGALPETQQVAKTKKQVIKQWDHKLASEAANALLYPKLLPLIEGEFVYRANHKGNLVSLNKQTGKKQWQVKTGYRIASGPTLIGDSLLIGTHDAKVVALDKKSGKAQWVSSVSSEVLAPPKGDGKVIVVNTIDGKTTGLDSESGQLLWTHDYVIPTLLLRGTTEPQLKDGYVFCGLANGKLVALHADSGKLAWENSVATPQGRSELHRMVDIKADLAMDGSDVYVAAFQSKLVKIDLTTGKTQWQKAISVCQNMCLEDEVIYITDENNHLWALAKSTGKTLWQQAALNKRFITAPSVVGDYVIVGDRGGYLHFIDKKTGDLKSRHLVGNKISSNLRVDNNTIFVLGQNGKLSVFKFVA